ncbi:MAG TPA: EscU/YscU/HrcU family type III secretion system export apparatus switch protein [Firmicutes bacterium]|nr:EscU/YscU/HrcU family type III secretion system export apparatus switch protein [Bacillota bacterium]
MEEKKEAPTPRKREKARQEGHVTRSAELSGALTLLGCYFALKFWGSKAKDEMLMLAQTCLGNGPVELDLPSVKRLFAVPVAVCCIILAPILLAAGIVGLVTQLAQGGFVASPAAISPKLERLSPARNIGQILSRRHLMDWLKNLLKMCVLGYVLWGTGRTQLGSLVGVGLVGAERGGYILAGAVGEVAYRCGLALLVLGLLDYGYQWWESEQALRMTRTELKEEIKETEGRPEVKSRIRAIQRRLASMRMMAQVKKADVVITNPDEFAVALKYEPAKMAAPMVLAKGRGFLAERIKQEARKAFVSIVPNPPLARALYSSTEVGQVIPPELYKAVAEVLAFVYRVKNRL